MKLSETYLAAALAHAATVAAQYSDYEDDGFALQSRDFDESIDLGIRDLDDVLDFDLDVRGEDKDEDEDSSSTDDQDDVLAAPGKTSPGDVCTSFINIGPDGRPFHVHRCTHPDGSVTTTPLARQRKDPRSLLLMSGDALPFAMDPFQQMLNSWFRPSPLDRMLSEFSTPAHRGHSHLLMIPPQGRPSGGQGMERLMHSLLGAGHNSVSSSASSTMTHSSINGKGMTCTSSLNIGPDGVPHHIRKCTSTNSKNHRPQLTLSGGNSGSRVFNRLSSSTKQKVLKALRSKRILDLEEGPVRGQIKTWSKHKHEHGKHKKHDKHEKDDHDEHKDHHQDDHKDEDEEKDDHESDKKDKHDDIKRAIAASEEFEDLFSREAEAEADAVLDPEIFIDFNNEDIFVREAEAGAEAEATLVARDPTADPEPEPVAEPFAQPEPVAEAKAAAEPEPLP